MICFVCHQAIPCGEPAYELALGHVPENYTVFVAEADPPPRHAHVRCLQTQEIIRPMKEIMQRYAGRPVVVLFNEGAPASGTLIAAGDTAFTLLSRGKEVSRPYSDVHTVTAEHSAPPDPATTAPDALSDPGDLPLAELLTDDELDDLDDLGFDL